MERHMRPAPDLVGNAYYHLFHSGLSQAKIKDAVIGGRLLSAYDNFLGIPGRSIAWKLFLLSDEPLQMPPDTPAVPPLASIRESRKKYVNSLLLNMRGPDGSYEEGFVVPGSISSPKRTDRVAADLEKNNPLSLDDENTWKEWFASVELRKTILQDVERTFPDIGYFRDADVQYQLTNILYLYSVSVPEIGYRQGMHELLAPLYYAVDYDSVSEDVDLKDPKLKELCSRTFVAADAWALFLAVMHGVSRWYEWREVEGVAGGGTPSSLANHVQLNPDGKVDLKPYIAPIVQDCDHLQGTLLRTVDPVLWKKLQASGIEPQIYGIRWLRLLFTREMNMQDAMNLWDGLFACDPTFEIVQWICIAMLIRIRNQLIPSDYSTQLTYLLRYPSTPSPDAPDLPHHTTLLLRQAVALQMSPNPSTGASIVVENRNLLNIPLEIPDPPPPPMRRRVRPSEQSHQLSASEGPSSADGRPSLQRQQSPMESIARNLLDRGESMGINKTFLSAVSELKRNLPDLAASLTRAPSASAPSYSAFPLVDDRPVEQRPSWEPRSRFEMERDISEMRSLNQRLGKSVSWIVDMLLQDEDGVKEPERLKEIQGKKREALESLSYVRDVLNGGVTKVEEERLWGEQEFRRRSEEVSTRHTRGSGSFERHDNQFINKPPPVSVSDIRGFRSLQTSTPIPRRTSFTGSRPIYSHSTALSTSMHASSPAPAAASWHSTQSSFGARSTVAPALPQVPPPASSSYHPPRIASPNKSPRLEVQHDPLGVL